MEGRRTTYDALICALDAAMSRKERGEPMDQPERVIRKTPHRCVWEEMKRQAMKIDALKPLFDAVPEAYASPLRRRTRSVRVVISPR